MQKNKDSDARNAIHILHCAQHENTCEIREKVNHHVQCDYHPRDDIHACVPARPPGTGGRAPPRAEAVVKLKNRTGVLQVVAKNRYSRRQWSQQSACRST